MTLMTLLMANLRRGMCGVVWALMFVVTPAPASAETLIDSDFSQGNLQKLGWKVEGAWDVFTYPGEKHNPGPVARMPARVPGGTLTKTFGPIQNPPSLSVSLDVGWGWGAPDHAESIGFMLLDEQGDGYLFQTQRAKATWGAQWAGAGAGVSPARTS